MVITDTISRLDLGSTRATLEPKGEIDAGSIEDLTSMVQRALRAGVTELDVDLRDVPFMDTAALRVLEHAREVLNSTGGFLCLRNAAPEVRRLLQLTAFVPGSITD
jgi:anti-anti-sigma factor